jgi:NADPH2:quinone reductase
MKAWIIEKFDGIENAKLVDVPDPKPAADEVVLRMKFASLNPADAYLAKGEYPAKPALPHVLGRDGIGEVVAIGADVRDIKIGEKKVLLRGEAGVSRWGTLAQLVSVATEWLVDVPANWSDEQAAAAPLVYVTAYQALTQWNDLPKSANVLISGASGGVGVASTQLALAMGHTVVGLSRSEEKSAKLRELGMQHVFDPSDATWVKNLKSTFNSGIDLAIDNIGGEGFNQMLSTMGNHGRISVVGRLAGPVPSFNTSALLFRRLKIGGVAIASYTNEESRQAWGKVLEILSRTNAKPLIDEVFPFELLPAAFARLAKGPMGKVIVKIA